MHKYCPNQTTVVKQFIPSTLELEKIIEKNPPNFVYKFHFFVQLIQLLYEIPAKNKSIEIINGYVPFNAQLLQKFERNYLPHLNYLIEQGILEEYSSYIPGKRSKSYRLAEKYLDGHLREIVVTDKKMSIKIFKQQKIDVDARIQYKYLHKWFNSNITIDRISAFDYCYKEAKHNSHLDYYSAYSDAYSKMMKLKFLENGYFWFTVDKKGNRLHTNFTNLNSSLKPFITYGGQELVSVDIKNSQPFMSIKVLKDFYQIHQETCLNNQSSPIMLVKPSQGLIPTDVLHYIELVTTGQFYEFMIEKFNEKFGDSYFKQPLVFDFDKKRMVRNTKTPRQQVKTAMFCIFFSQNKWVVKEKSLFKDVFPNVMHVFEDIKKYHHNALACELQQIEANLILDNACKVISIKRPELPLFTIHDSIVTTKGNEWLVENMLKNVLKEAIGFEPQLEISSWSTDEETLRKAA